MSEIWYEQELDDQGVAAESAALARDCDPAREFGQVHVLKIDGGWYGRLCEGAKTHEVRRHDRDFQVGDLLRFRIVGDGPSSPLAPRDWLITHVLPLSHVPEANFSASWCVLSLREVPGDE